MSFLVNAKLEGYEFRGQSTGTSKKGTAFKVVRVEAPDGATAEISCSDSELFRVVDALRKGSVYDFPVRCVAGRDRSYIQLVDAPVWVRDPDYSAA